MDQWEYMPTYLEAKVDGKEIREFLKEQTGVKRPPRFMIESLMPQLDKLGSEGWELVHMEPVPRVGKKGNVLLGASYRWSNIYFCVFKRQKASAEPQVEAPVVVQSVPEDVVSSNGDSQVEDLPIAPRAPFPPPPDTA